MFKLIWSIHLPLAAVIIFSACSAPQTSTAVPTLVTYGISLRVEPILVTNLGDRVTGPVTVYVDAPGATRVEVYLMPMDQPVGGKPTGDPQLIGVVNKPGDHFAVPWAADTPYSFVQVWATAFGQPDVNYSRSSDPIPLIISTGK